MIAWHTHFFKRNPFVKLLLPFIAGIICQWYLQVSATLFWWIISGCTIFLLLFLSLPLFKRFQLSLLATVFINLIFFSVGALLSYNRNVKNDAAWFGNHYAQSDAMVVELKEPLTEKTKSFKADAKVIQLIQNGISTPTTGTVIVYFKKDSLLPLLKYGSIILFKKALQPIKNADNPGGFDYQRYALFKGITHQVFLTTKDYELLPQSAGNPLKQQLINIRQGVINILRLYITGKREVGLAEALLIGYKDDLDQSLVQSYTNTGVVHIIAISGLHLGLIYWLLATICKPLRRRKKIKWLVPWLMVTGLWLFAFLAGSQPSVLRAALMFTFIVLGESFKRKTSIYNTLAASAFLLLCINPYWLWDVGFQLSYAAVASIVTFMQPIYHWFYIKNKILDFFWKLTAVTLSAQVFTLAISIYHFHQFPLLFILTNFIAVPLASAILIGEVILCVLSFIPMAAVLVGKILTGIIWFLNTYISRVELIPFSLWDGLQITLPQMFLLLLASALIGGWLMEKNLSYLKFALLIIGSFVVLRSHSFYLAQQQQKIIVYNVPQKKGIDFIDGRKYYFMGDSDLKVDGFARNFHLKPSRILNRIIPNDSMSGFLKINHFIRFAQKNVLLLDRQVSFERIGERPKVDLLVLSGNPRIYIANLIKDLDIKQLVIDGSVPSWKAKYWKKDCDSLKLPWYDVATMGAFVLDL